MTAGACNLLLLLSELRMATSTIEALIAGLGEEEVRAGAGFGHLFGD